MLGCLYVKVGMTNNLKARCRALSSGLPNPFYMIFWIQFFNGITDAEFFDWLEAKYPNCRGTSEQYNKFHTTELIDLRVINLQTLIIEMLEFAHKKGNISVLSNAELYITRRPNFSFNNLGILPGSILTFQNKKSAMNGTEVRVVNDNQIEYNGAIYSTSTLAKIFLNAKNNVNGSNYFYYNGQSITELKNDFENDFFN